MKKSFLSIALALLLVLSCVLTACDGSSDDPSTDGEPTEYTVRLQILTRPVEGAMLLIKDGENNIKKIVTTDAEGKAVFTLPARADYRVYAADTVEERHLFTEGGYPLEAGETVIQLTPSVIQAETDEGFRYREGSTLHEITVVTVDGETFSLSEVLKTKKAVVINFFFTNCGPCKSEMPYFEAAHKAYGDEVAFIAVIPGYLGENDQKATAFRDQYGLTFDVAYTEKTDLVDDFHITAYPTTAVIDRYGTLCLLETGTLPSADPLLTVCERLVAEDYQQVLYDDFDHLSK